ncbi:MAG: hypothetical protein WBB01_19845 [Phormidesmis sp.]
MSIRWQKILVVLAPVAVVGVFPLVYERLNPDYFSGIACVRVYPDQSIEKDRGESCYDPDLPAAIVLRQR